MSQLLDFQCSPWWNVLPLVNGRRLDAEGLGKSNSAAEVLDYLVEVVSVHGCIISLLIIYINTLMVTPMVWACKMSYMNIGQRIKQARLAHKPKITQQQLAVAVGVSQPAVTQWETGESRTLEGENLVLVARALGVTTDWLLYGTGPGPGEPIPSSTKASQAANDEETGLSRRAFMMGQIFDQLSPDEQDALHALFDALAESKTKKIEITKKAG